MKRLLLYTKFLTLLLLFLLCMTTSNAQHANSSAESPSPNHGSDLELEKIRPYLEIDPSRIKDFEVSLKQGDYEVDVNAGDKDLPGASGPVIEAHNDEGFSLVMDLVSKGQLSPVEILDRNEQVCKLIHSNPEYRITPSASITAVGPEFTSIEDKGTLSVAGETMPYLTGRCPERPGQRVLFGVFQPQNKNVSVLITATQPGGGKFNIEPAQTFLNSLKEFRERHSKSPHWGPVHSATFMNEGISKIANITLPLPANFHIKEVNQANSLLIVENTKPKQMITIDLVPNHKPSAEAALNELSHATAANVVSTEERSKYLPANVKVQFRKLMHGAPYKAIKQKGKLTINDMPMYYLLGITATGAQAFVGYLDGKKGFGLEVVFMQRDGNPLDFKAVQSLLDHIKGPPDSPKGK
jgi:hypothetical protein